MFFIVTFFVNLSRSICKCIFEKDRRAQLDVKRLETQAGAAGTIYQTHESNLLDWSLYCPTAQLVHMNRNYAYTFFTAQERRVFLVNEFSEHSRQVMAYDMLRDGTSKSDIFRLCLLYARGGTYLDCKATTIVPLDNFVPMDSHFCAFIDTKDSRLSTSFISCAARNPLIEAIMNEALERVLKRQYGANPLDIAGPEMLGAVVRKFLGIENLRIGRFSVAGITVDLIGRSRLCKMFESFMCNEAGEPLIKRQPSMYIFKNLSARYEISWILRRAFL